MGVKRVQVHIERLVLRGVGEAAPGALAAALQQELERALTQVQGGGWRGDAHVARLAVGSLPITAWGTPAEIGKHAGQRIGRGLSTLAGGRDHG